MKTALSLVSILAGACALTAPLNAVTTTIFSDNFNTDQSGNYARSNADGTTDMVLNGSGGNLTVTPGGANNGDRTLLRTFDAVTLVNEGDAIRFSVDFYITSNGNPLRFGLYDINGTITDGSLSTASVDKEGYFTFFYNNAASASTLRREYSGGTAAIMTGSATGGTTSPTNRPFVTQLASDSETMSFLNVANISTMVLTITKGADGNNLVESAIYKGGSITSYAMSATETDGFGVSTFNTISFLTLANQTIYDNITVEFISTIPEPSSFAALAGGAAMMAVALRRRRHAG